MLRLLPGLAGRYRLANVHEVRCWSFGQLKAVRRPDAANWRRRVDTLADERIFGPLCDLECPCGTYRGPACQGMICDRCGVKVTTRQARRERMGHIELPIQLPHPLGDESDLVSAVPVLLAVYFESVAGHPLAHAYESLIEFADQASRDKLQVGLEQLISVLLPVVTFAHDWNLGESVLLARGLVLEVAETVL
jgi:hypothetical protein